MDGNSDETPPALNSTTLPFTEKSHPKQKRAAEDAVSSSSTSKRPKIDEIEETSIFPLTYLPEDVLLIILANLDHRSLSSLSKTCTLFTRLCSDFTLWRTVEYSSAPASVEELEYIISNVHEDTTAIRVLSKFTRSYLTPDSVTPEWFNAINLKCTNLKYLALPNHNWNCQVIPITSFPKTLTTLDLTGTHLLGTPIGKSYFKDISLCMPDLKVLILSNCPWFEPHSLMAISKCKFLEELRINDCEMVRDCLAYCGLSTRGGFKSLKTLDLRRCSISNSELICFSSVVTLKNIYLEFSELASISINHVLPSMFMTDRGWCPHRPKNRIRLEKLVVRNYTCLNDDFFKTFVNGVESLKYIDITGSLVTSSAIEAMKVTRPHLKIVCENSVPSEEKIYSKMFSFFDDSEV